MLGLWLGLRWARRRVVRRVARSRRKGVVGEATATKLLTRRGFAIVEAQPSATARVRVAGELREFALRGDYLVSGRDGGRWLVEVKGGLDSARVANSATRRQLLEYACAFDVDGLMLLDAARGELLVVEFPDLK